MTQEPLESTLWKHHKKTRASQSLRAVGMLLFALAVVAVVCVLAMG